MRMRVSSGLSITSSLCFVLCLAKGAHARGPEWFEPADPAKPPTSESKGDAPKAPPGEGAAGTTKGEATKAEATKVEATKGEATKGEVQAQPPAPCPAPAPPPRAVAKPKRDEPPPPQTEWYGWQTILTDLGSIALVAAGSSANDEGGDGGGAMAAGVGMYFLGAPVVHAANGQWGKGVGSLGLRVGAPLTGMLGGFMLGTATCPEDDGINSAPLCPLGQALVGGMLGLVAASVIDASVLAKKEVRPKPAVSLAPSVVPTKQGTTFGLAGTF